MIDARADVSLPVDAATAFAVATDLADADWLPAVRGLRHAGGPTSGVGARWDVEVGLTGRHLRGTLVCRELDPPRRAVFVLEEGLDLSVTISVRPLEAGCSLELLARYGVRGPLGPAAERASVGGARREAARAVEQLAARFRRRSPATT